VKLIFFSNSALGGSWDGGPWLKPFMRFGAQVSTALQAADPTAPIVWEDGDMIFYQQFNENAGKKAVQVIALERATLYGIVIYANRRVDFGNVDPAAARAIFIREALVAGEWETRLPFMAANRKLIAQIEELEHKSRRQDVLVDDELIFAFYDQQVPADVHSGERFERWYREEAKRQPRLLLLAREELMRHEAAGITTAASTDDEAT
jgi:ATP-dependent helicase HrpA